MQKHTKKSLLVISPILHSGQRLRDYLSRMSRKARLNGCVLPVSQVGCEHYSKFRVSLIHLFTYFLTIHNRTLFSSLPAEKRNFHIPDPLTYIDFNFMIIKWISCIYFFFSEENNNFGVANFFFIYITSALQCISETHFLYNTCFLI